MPPAPVLVLLAAGAILYYGGKAVIPATGHFFKRSAQVISQPFRHPKKDAVAIKKAVIRKPNTK